MNVPPFSSSSQNTMKATRAAMTCVRMERLGFLTMRGRRRELSRGVASSAAPAAAASPSLSRRLGDTGTEVWGEVRSDMALSRDSKIGGLRCDAFESKFWESSLQGGGGAEVANAVPLTVRGSGGRLQPTTFKSMAVQLWSHKFNTGFRFAVPNSRHYF